LELLLEFSEKEIRENRDSGTLEMGQLDTLRKRQHDDLKLL